MMDNIIQNWNEGWGGGGHEPHVLSATRKIVAALLNKFSVLCLVGGPGRILVCIHFCFEIGPPPR
jgi:hypothetical protein